MNKHPLISPKQAALWAWKWAHNHDGCQNLVVDLPTPHHHAMQINVDTTNIMHTTRCGGNAARYTKRQKDWEGLASLVHSCTERHLGLTTATTSTTQQLNVERVTVVAETFLSSSKASYMCGKQATKLNTFESRLQEGKDITAALRRAVCCQQSSTACMWGVSWGDTRHEASYLCMCKHAVTGMRSALLQTYIIHTTSQVCSGDRGVRMRKLRTRATARQGKQRRDEHVQPLPLFLAPPTCQSNLRCVVVHASKGSLIALPTQRSGLSKWACPLDKV